MIHVLTVLKVWYNILSALSPPESHYSIATVCQPGSEHPALSGSVISAIFAYPPRLWANRCSVMRRSRPDA